jgi:excisionase family DNA binding protein
MTESLVSVKAAADRLALSVPTLRAWISSRKIGVVRLGRAVRISERELTRLLEAGYVPARPEGDLRR